MVVHQTRDVRLAHTYGACAGTDAADSFIIEFDASNEDPEYPAGIRGRSKWQLLYEDIRNRAETFTSCIPNPLSGEWAGESLMEMSRDYQINFFHDSVQEAFTESFDAAFIQRCSQQADRNCPEITVEVTVALGDGIEITRSMRFDPTDIYDAATGVELRDMAREMLGISLDSLPREYK